MLCELHEFYLTHKGSVRGVLSLSFVAYTSDPITLSTRLLYKTIRFTLSKSTILLFKAIHCFVESVLEVSTMSAILLSECFKH